MSLDHLKRWTIRCQRRSERDGETIHHLSLVRQIELDMRRLRLTILMGLLHIRRRVLLERNLDALNPDFVALFWGASTSPASTPVPLSVAGVGLGTGSDDR